MFLPQVILTCGSFWKTENDCRIFARQETVPFIFLCAGSHFAFNFRSFLKSLSIMEEMELHPMPLWAIQNISRESKGNRHKRGCKAMESMDLIKYSKAFFIIVLHRTVPGS